MEPSGSNFSINKPSQKGKEKSINLSQNLEEVKKGMKKLNISSGEDMGQ